MNTDDVLKEINDASMEIPFENSQFQTDNFVINGQITPGRAYRAILLRLNNRIRALNEAKYSLAKEDIDIEELRFNILEEKNKDKPNTFDIRRWDLEINKKLENRSFTQKLVNDALVEVVHLYKTFKKFPKYTREQFEAEEKEHFRISLTRQQQGLSGPSSSLIDMGQLSVGEDLKTQMSLLEIVTKEMPELEVIDSPIQLE